MYCIHLSIKNFSNFKINCLVVSSPPITSLRSRKTFLLPDFQAYISPLQSSWHIGCLSFVKQAREFPPETFFLKFFAHNVQQSSSSSVYMSLFKTYQLGANFFSYLVLSMFITAELFSLCFLIPCSFYPVLLIHSKFLYLRQHLSFLTLRFYVTQLITH